MGTKMKKIQPKSSKQRYKHYDEKKKTLPHISFQEADFPEVDKWKIGEKYHIEMEVEMVSKDEHGGGFEIHKFGGSPMRVKRKKED